MSLTIYIFDLKSLILISTMIITITEIMIRIQSIQNTMEILIGGSARRATIAIMRPK